MFGFLMDIKIENKSNSMISKKIDIGSLLFVKSHSLHLLQEDNNDRGVTVALNFNIMGFLLYEYG